MLIAAFAAVSAAIVIRQRTLSARAAEKYAMEFVLMDGGYVSNGYTSSRLGSLFAPFGGAAIGRTPQRSVAFPIDRMTDDVAKSLVDIRDLYAIILYPPDPDGSGVDFAATTMRNCASLRELDLPLSEKGIAILQERCPDLIIQVASRPAVDSASSTDLAE